MDGELISSYTRAEALDDGALIDVSAMAREAGFVWPVAVTQALMADIEHIPLRLCGLASKEGRLWDVLWMAFCAIRLSRDGGTHLVYQLIMPVGESRQRYYTAMLVSAPGDDGEPVITLMKPGER